MIDPFDAIGKLPAARVTGPVTTGTLTYDPALFPAQTPVKNELCPADDFQHTPLDAAPMLDACPMFKAAKADGGVGVPQGVWMNQGLALTFCKDGKTIFHEISKGYAKYQPADTDEMWERKLAESAVTHKDGLRWPSCHSFEEYGSPHCKTCPLKSTVKSPLNLAWLTVQSANASQCKESDFGECKSVVHPAGISFNDFYAYMPTHNYIYAPTGEMWPASSVNSRLGSVATIPAGKKSRPNADAEEKPDANAKEKPDADAEEKPNADAKEKRIPASKWLDRNQPVEQATWAPGRHTLIHDQLIRDGGWIQREGVTCFNLYRPPTIELGNALEAGRWCDHLHKVFRDDDEHIVRWLAHRVQRPHEKINHGLVFGGSQGIGKDTLLEPVKRAVGPWNFSEVSPRELLGDFNGFAKSVILRVNEARDLGDVNRFSFYDHMKTYTAAPPDVLRVNEKHLREHYVLNCCGVIITTNHKADGIFLPADDRRHFVAWSQLSKEDFSRDYWNGLWGWYEHGGFRHIAAYLAELDISSFDPKAPPPKTTAFWDIVDANRAPEDAELADVLDRMQNPAAVTLDQVTNKATGNFQEWLKERRNRRAIPHRLEQCGYAQVRNAAAQDGLWVVKGKRQVIYARSDLQPSDRLKAVGDLARRIGSH